MPITSCRLVGVNENSVQVPINMCPEGNLMVDVNGSILPFGSLHTESLTPWFQSDGVYGLNAQQQISTVSGSGVATTENSAFKVSTGTTALSTASIQSFSRLRYRAGQGIVGRFTAAYTSPVASSYQVAGFGHAEDGVYFGYKNLEFGILYNKRGVREVRTLTISTASSTSENVTVTLNGVAHSIAVTNSANIQRTVYELSLGVYAGFKACGIGATIVFIANDAGPKASSFSVSGTTIVGSFATTKTGVSVTETFIPQSSFNCDKLDGTGNSNVTIDPTKLNIFQIKMQYLGAGPIVFEVEITQANKKPKFIKCHVIEFQNSLTDTTFSNPSFPFTMAAYSAGSTTNLSVKCGSFAGFIEGMMKMHGPRFTYFNQLTSVGSTNYQCLFSMKNKRVFKTMSNQSVVHIISVSAAIKHTSPVVIYLIKNGTLAGNPSFSDYSTDSSTCFDNSATTITVSNNSQILWAGHLGDTGELDHHFENGEVIDLQPGEMITLAAKSVSGTPSHVTGSINTREDQ